MLINVEQLKAEMKAFDRKMRFIRILITVIVSVAVIALFLVITSNKAEGKVSQTSTSSTRPVTSVAPAAAVSCRPRICALFRHVHAKMRDAKGPRNYAPYVYSRRDKITANNAHILVPSLSVLNHPRRGYRTKIVRMHQSCPACQMTRTSPSLAAAGSDGPGDLMCITYAMWANNPLPIWQRPWAWDSGPWADKPHPFRFTWKAKVCNYYGKPISSAFSWGEIHKASALREPSNVLIKYRGPSEKSETLAGHWYWRAEDTYLVDQCAAKFIDFCITWNPHVSMSTDAFWYGRATGDWYGRMTWLD